MPRTPNTSVIASSVVEGWSGNWAEETGKGSSIHWWIAEDEWYTQGKRFSVRGRTCEIQTKLDS